jgi:hypothetical protein
MVEKIAPLYTEMFARNVPNPQKTFIQLLEKVGDFKEPNYIRHCILWCINRDIDCLTVWKLNFERLAGDSLDFLNYMGEFLRNKCEQISQRIFFLFLRSKFQNFDGSGCEKCDF